MDDTAQPDAFYERLDGETFRATGWTSSPWGAHLQHGGPPTALLARVLADAFPRDDMRIARVASEFLGAIPVATMRARVRVARPGKRIEMLEGTLEIEGREVVSTRVWRIAVQPDGSVAPGVTPPDPVPPIPALEPVWFDAFPYGRAIEWRFVHGGDGPGPAAVWARPRITLIAGEPMHGPDAALAIVDSANGVSGELSMHEWLFVPPSLSVALERYPRSDWVLLDARTSMTSDGLGVTSFRIGDEHGWIGAGTQALLVERRA